MRNKKNRGYSKNNRSNGGYNNGNYNGGYKKNKKNKSYGPVPYGCYVNDQGEIVKRKGGAKEVQGQTKEGRDYFGVSAWFYRENTGMVSINAFVNEKSTWFPDADNPEGVTMMWEVFYRNTGVKRITIASYFFDSGKAYLKDLGIMVSTKANDNGGWAGFIPSQEDKEEYKRQMGFSNGRNFVMRDSEE